MWSKVSCLRETTAIKRPTYSLNSNNDPLIFRLSNQKSEVQTTKLMCFQISQPFFLKIILELLTSQTISSSSAFPGTPLKLSGHLSGTVIGIIVSKENQYRRIDQVQIRYKQKRLGPEITLVLTIFHLGSMLLFGLELIAYDSILVTIFKHHHF